MHDKVKIKEERDERVRVWKQGQNFDQLEDEVEVQEANSVDPKVEKLLEYGFGREQIIEALRVCYDDEEKAIEHLLS